MNPSNLNGLIVEINKLRLAGKTGNAFRRFSPLFTTRQDDVFFVKYIRIGRVFLALDSKKLGFGLASSATT